jgi:predicted enzyme related to lactoylglutathione lyase
MATLSYVNVATRDLDRLPRFYMDLFGFEEVREVQTPVFRAVLTGRTTIGFNAAAVYQTLNLPVPPESAAGTKLVLTFDVDSVGDVDSSIIRAVSLGAKLVKPAFRTSYGYYQGVLLDPEANGFRINTILQQRR